MKNKKIIIYGATLNATTATSLFVHTMYASSMLSYLSSDPKACINRHVMHSAYTIWDNSSHKNVAKCIDRHLPVGDEVAKYTAKAIDGWDHSVAFTLNTYKNNIRISDNTAEHVQANCIRCHNGVSETVQKNTSSYHSKRNFDKDRKCWECHKYVPHGKARNLISTPYGLGIREHLK